MGTDFTPALELWGGIECTVNRVGDRYFDQIVRTGHDRRAGDLDRFAALGLKRLRYPVLWERTSNAAVDRFDWTWSDERLGRMKCLGIDPIVGLVHHGSGPPGTSLLERSFSDGLARFARAVAERYPHVRDYTPVNEPLTTARFSGLYGHWYPHHRDPLSFGLALVEQCRAIVLAMQAIRGVRPDARLVQSEDLGKTYSTPKLGYQAAFENERRWLTWDLLSGRVRPGHPMWSYLTWAGVPKSDLRWFLDHCCVPDLIGVNHYLTSERFLDHRVGQYPAHTIGGNGKHSYADVEAARVLPQGPGGFEPLLEEVCARYGAPVAITEVHNGCTREEQLRWFMEAWTGARRVRARGGPVAAVTAWALLGSVDWDSLVTEDRSRYEPGVFDVRAPHPRETALAELLRELAAGGEAANPLFDTPGWWRRPGRLIVETRTARNPDRSKRMERPVLITGKTGTLGRAFERVCAARGIAYRLLGRDELDIADPASVAAAFQHYRPWAVINTAGFVRVDAAEDDRETCFRENADGAEVLARFCASSGTRLVTFSSDLVFDGLKTRPYVESDEPAPLNVYGASKAQAERQVLACLPSGLVIRTSAFFGPWDEHNFVFHALRDLAAGRTVRATGDLISPTYIPDLVSATLDLMIDGESGIWHLSNEGETTWVALARNVAERADLPKALIEAASSSRMGWTARRPHRCPLASEKAQLMPPLESALERYFRECTVVWRSEELAASG